MTGKAIKAPFPWFGGKSQVAAEVWRRLGPVDNYVEPFAGSAAMLLARPGGAQGIETINDADALLANFWRAMSFAPDDVIHHADWPVNEADLHARHLWLVGQRERITERLMGDPDWYDARAAGWWVWGCSLWIGSGWCSGDGAWAADNGVFGRRSDPSSPGVARQLPHLTTSGQGVHGRHGPATMRAAAQRFRKVRVTCGDWTRVLGACLQPCGGKAEALRRGYVTAVFLDPPYGEGFDGAYAATGGLDHDARIAADVWRWATVNGDDPTLRIAVAGYEDGREVPPGWFAVRWKAAPGYSVQSDGESTNRSRETVWFSPHCLTGQAQLGLGL